jgi:hypothetical protein
MRANNAKLYRGRIPRPERSFSARLNIALSEISFKAPVLAAKLKVTERTVYNWWKNDVGSINAYSLSLLQQQSGYSSIWITTGREPRKIGTAIEDDPLVYDRDAVARLPQEEKERIQGFIEFTLQHYELRRRQKG